MRALFSVVVLSCLSFPALANPYVQVPEPESMALLAIGALGLALARRRKH